MHRRAGHPTPNGRRGDGGFRNNAPRPATSRARRRTMLDMARDDVRPDPDRPPAGPFQTTHWSLVLAARDRGTPQADHALAELCAAYWYPLYAFIRRRGHDPDRSADLTQGFFARFLEKDYLNSVDPSKGR